MNATAGNSSDFYAAAAIFLLGEMFLPEIADVGAQFPGISQGLHNLPWLIAAGAFMHHGRLYGNARMAKDKLGNPAVAIDLHKAGQDFPFCGFKPAEICPKVSQLQAWHLFLRPFAANLGKGYLYVHSPAKKLHCEILRRGVCVISALANTCGPAVAAKTLKMPAPKNISLSAANSGNTVQTAVFHNRRPSAFVAGL